MSKQGLAKSATSWPQGVAANIDRFKSGALAARVMMPIDQFITKRIIVFESKYLSLFRSLGGFADMDFSSRTDFDHWGDELVEYFEELGGTVKLPDLYRHIAQHPKRELKRDWQKRVRFSIYGHSSDSRIWRHGRDLFQHIGHNSGIWSLRDRDVLNVSEDPEHFKEDVSPSLPPARRRQVLEVIVRNQRLVEKTKKERNYTCERCGYRSPWLTGKRTPYVEAHHLIPLGENGYDAVGNLIIVCAECHRFLHHAAERRNEIARMTAARRL